jgi:hypothetical protein
VGGTPRRGHVPRLAAYFNRLSSPIDDRGRSVKSHRLGRQRRVHAWPATPQPNVVATASRDATRFHPEAMQVWQGHSPRKPLGFEAIASLSEPHGLRCQ